MISIDAGEKEQEDSAATRRSAALEHAWNWFKYHAEQRLKVFQFFLVANGLIVTGIGAGLINDLNFLAFAVCDFGIIVSIAFYRLDKRVSQLVKIGERAMRIEEAKLSKVSGNSNIEICKSTEEPSTMDHGSYSDAFRLVFFSLGFLYFSSAVYSLWKLAGFEE
jgi:hypothetical protein